MTENDTNEVRVVVEHPPRLYIDGVLIHNLQDYKVTYEHGIGQYVTVSITFVTNKATGTYIFGSDIK